MHPQFWLGLFVPALTLLTVAIVWITLAFASVLWRRLHRRLLSTLTLVENPRERENQVSTITRAMLSARRLRMIEGFGWVVVWSRESRLATVPATEPA